MDLYPNRIYTDNHLCRTAVEVTAGTTYRIIEPVDGSAYENRLRIVSDALLIDNIEGNLYGDEY